VYCILCSVWLTAPSPSIHEALLLALEEVLDEEEEDRLEFFGGDCDGMRSTTCEPGALVRTLQRIQKKGREKEKNKNKSTRILHSNPTQTKPNQTKPICKRETIKLETNLNQTNCTKQANPNKTKVF
jgi:hypothetical protein